MCLCTHIYIHIYIYIYILTQGDESGEGGLYNAVQMTDVRGSARSIVLGQLLKETLLRKGVSRDLMTLSHFVISRFSNAINSVTDISPRTATMS